MNWRKIFVILSFLVLMDFLPGDFCQINLSAQQLPPTPFSVDDKKVRWNHLQRLIPKEMRRFKGQTGILIQDLQTGWEWNYQAEKPFPAASLIKVPIMVACFQAVQEGRLQPAQEVVLRSKDKVSGSGKLKSIPPGVSFTVEQLIDRMITGSDNTATNMLIDLLGIDYLNDSFKKNGLESTHLSRKMMDFSKRKRGVENYTTAAEISLLLQRIYAHGLVSPEVSEKCLNLLKRQKLHDRIPKKLPKGTVVAHKTGLEEGVCHDAGIVFTPEGDYLICVLTRNGKQSAPAKRFIAQLAWLTYRYMMAASQRPSPGYFSRENVKGRIGKEE